MTADALTIGAAARAAGLTPKMLRHYEQLGLLAPAARSAAGYRHYTEADLATLRFIRRARDLGFSLPQVRELLTLWHGHCPRSEVRALAQKHLEDLERRRAELDALAANLRTLADACRSSEGVDEACPILRELEGAG